MSTETELVALRERVNKLEELVQYLYKHLNVTYTSLPSTENPSIQPILDQLKKGNLIEAIKIHREMYNTGLVDAKKAVEEIKARYRL